MKNKPVFLFTAIKYLILSMGLFFIINTAKAGIIEGDPAGKVTLVEFYDYTCPYCHAMNPTFDKVIKQNPGLRIIYRPLPILRPESWWIAASVIASTHQQDFLVLHQAIMNAHEPLTQRNILIMAVNAGINPQQLLSDMRKPAITQELQSNLQVANKIGIHQLPTIIIGASQAKAPTAVFYGMTSSTQLQAAIEKAAASE